MRDATVLVFAEFGSVTGSGTGFHLGNGIYVSAAHVVLNEVQEVAREIWIGASETGQFYPAEVVSVGEWTTVGPWTRDLVTLRAQPIGSALDWRAPSQAQDQDLEVRVLGYPWSLEIDRSEEVPSPAIVRGTIINVATVAGVTLVQFSDEVQQGMSGGPLVDACGTALAVTSGTRVESAIDGLRVGFPTFISLGELQALP